MTRAAAAATCGTLAGYTVAGCRCRDCSAAAARHGKRYRVRRARNHGDRLLVDAAPAQHHVRDLLAAGMPFRAIALTAGWASRNSLTSFLQTTRAHPSTVARVLAVTPDRDTRADVLVPAHGARHRLRALAAIGWTHRALAEHLGAASHDGLVDISNATVTEIRRATHDSIRDLYDRLSMTPGPSQRARSRAALLGWAPPLAWDDDTIDEFLASPTPTGPTLYELDDAVQRAGAAAAHGTPLPRAREEAAHDLEISVTTLRELVRDYMPAWHARLWPGTGGRDQRQP